MKHLGDFDLSAVAYSKFTTYQPSTGAPFTLAGTPAVSVYKDGSATQSTAGVTLTADFDALTGLNHLAIDTSADGTFYSAGSHFEAVITTGTVDGVSVVGSVVASFSLRKDSALKPTTAGRTLDVSAGGEAGLDWANIGSPTTAQNLSGTNIDVDQVVASVSGNVVGSVGTVNAIAANAITAAATASDFGTEVGTAVWATTTRQLTALDEDTTTLDLDATIRAALGMASANLDTQLTAIDDAIDTEVGAIKAKTDQLTFTVANQVDVNVVDWKGATAPAMTGDAFARLGAPAGASVSADIAAVAAKTTNLPTDPADQSLIIAATDAVMARIGAPVGASISADIAAVKTDTAATRTSADHLDDTLELTSDGYVFTVDALANAPSGPGGGGPTADEIADEVQTRTIAAVAVVNGLAANVITAAATAPDFTTEVTASLATAAALSAVASDVDAIGVLASAIDAKTTNLPADPADASVVAGLIAGVDAKVDIVDANVDAILLDTGTDGVVVATASKTGYQLSSAGVDDILDDAVDGSTTVRQSLRLHNAVLGGKASGLETTEATYRDLADTKNRVVATVDADGNRTAITRDLT